jgi:hypothetical protein
MSTKKKEVRFTLLENGLDFILSALEHISDNPSDRELKYAILHLSSGVELVLKERLKQEHWSLVFEKIEKVNKQSYEAGEFESVRIDTCIDRLNGICGLSFRPEHKEALKHLRNKRNKLEHFSSVDSTDAMKSATAKVLSIVLDFIVKNLSPKKFNKTEIRIFKEIKSKVMELEDFAKHRMETLKGELGEKSKDCYIIQCPACYQEALILGDGDPKCLFCFYEDEPNKVANEYLETIQNESSYIAVTQGGEYPLYQCPSCSEEAFIRLNNDGIGNFETTWVCFCCGESWGNNIDLCTSCNNPYVNDDESSVCMDCFRNSIDDD